jgi:hypothetical protein
MKPMGYILERKIKLDDGANVSKNRGIIPSGM